MKKVLFICLFVGAGWINSSQAHAMGFALDATLGSSHTFNIGGRNAQNPMGNFGSSIEIMPSWQFLMLSADLGLKYDFLQDSMTLRPGVRLHLGWLYFRAATPVAFSFRHGATTEPVDLGILVGAGARIRLGKWAFVAEANLSPFFLHIDKNGLSMPAEIRMGLSYKF